MYKSSFNYLQRELGVLICRVLLPLCHTCGCDFWGVGPWLELLNPLHLEQFYSKTFEGIMYIE